MNRIAELRKLNNLSQRELASAVGVSDISVSKWENGKTYPTGENLRRLAEILHCEPEDILQDIKKEPQNSVELTAAEKRLFDTIRELPEDRRDVACLTAELAVRGKVYRDLLAKLDEVSDMAERIMGNGSR
jgi:transcriptional regulator with XRE-family HTH domain|nr:MAG TPA: Repressor protein CI [Caudoviricetes sp.]